MKAISFSGKGMAFLLRVLRMVENIVIVSGGRLGDEAFFQKRILPAENRLLIACDGGARHLVRAGLKPDILIGDMDSLDPVKLADYERQDVRIIRHPARKDYTDTALALDYALSLHPRTLDIWGALGGRMDHALANIHLLIRGRDAGTATRLLDEYCEAFIACGKTEWIDAVGCLVSLIALSPVVEGITLEGFEYPLRNESLFVSESRGISNIICAEQASIRVEAGNLLVIRYWRKDVFPEVV
jgi:thiamine pyrophosphokinase